MAAPTGSGSKRGMRVVQGPMSRSAQVARQKQSYLKAVARLGTLSAGCRAARCDHGSVYGWRSTDPAFVEAEKAALEACADRMEEAAIKRGIARSDLMLIFMLKAMRPDKYRENLRAQVSSEITVRYANDWRPAFDADYEVIESAPTSDKSAIPEAPPA